MNLEKLEWGEVLGGVERSVSWVGRSVNLGGEEC